MGTAMPFREDQPFEEKVKCLADDELLEMWAESQEMECLVNMRAPFELNLPPGYEQVIIKELALRVSQRLVSHSRA